MQSIRAGARLPFLQHRHQQHPRTMGAKSICTPRQQPLLTPALHNQDSPPGLAKGASEPVYSAVLLTSLSVSAATSELCPGATLTFLGLLDVFILFFRPRCLLFTRPNRLVELSALRPTPPLLMSFSQTGGGPSSEFLKKDE